jgi:hypothetical protein
MKIHNNRQHRPGGWRGKPRPCRQALAIVRRFQSATMRPEQPAERQEDTEKPATPATGPPA